MSTTFSTTAPAWTALEALDKFKQTGPSQYEACCPAHDDRDPSLSIGIDANGVIGLTCHGPCTSEEVVKALGCMWADLFPAKEHASNGHMPTPRIVATYDYRDELGVLLYQAVRYVPKDFKRRRPDGKGGWIWKLDDMRRVPYRLLDLARAELADSIFLVEGEKDADRLAALGILATTTIGGADALKQSAKELAEALTDRRVVIVQDMDDAGDKYAAAALKLLQPVTAAAAVLKLPRLKHVPNHGEDVSDWLDTHGGTVDELRSLAEHVLKQSAKQTTQEPHAAWETPTPLPDNLPPVDPFDMALVPAPLRGWVWDIAQRMAVAPDGLAVGALVVAGALVGRRIGIRPKRHDDWLVVPNLWGAFVARPSMLKSPALAEVMKPLDRLIARASAAFEAANSAYAADLMQAEARKAAIADKMKKAAKDNNEAALRALVAEASNLEIPQKPTAQRYKTNDPTVEKVGELLLQNPNGLLIYRDELSGWLRSLEKQGREGDREFYLESWNGTNSYDVDRIGRGSLHIPALCLSLLGGIQPGKLAGYVHAATDGGSGDDGLLQRFQLLVWPDQVAWKKVDRWPDTEAKQRAYGIYEGLAALTPEQCGLVSPDDAEQEPPALRFDEQGQAIFDTWRDELELRVRSGTLPEMLESHLAKYRSLMPSLAVLFHLQHVVDGTAACVSAVGAASAQQAAAWCEYLEPHVNRLYASAMNPSLERARALLGHLQAGEVADGATLRDIYRHHWALLDNEDEASDAVKMLDGYDWVKMEAVKETGGRPSTSIRLHPDLLNIPR